MGKDFLSIQIGWNSGWRRKYNWNSNDLFYFGFWDEQQNGSAFFFLMCVVLLKVWTQGTGNWLTICLLPPTYNPTNTLKQKQKNKLTICTCADKKLFWLVYSSLWFFSFFSPYGLREAMRWTWCFRAFGIIFAWAFIFYLWLFLAIIFSSLALALLFF